MENRYGVLQRWSGALLGGSSVALGRLLLVLGGSTVRCGRSRGLDITYKLFVGSLSSSANARSLEEFFACDGGARVASLGKDPDTGECRRFGFVQLADPASAEMAIVDLEAHRVDGEAVQVRIVENSTAAPTAATTSTTITQAKTSTVRA